MTAKSIASVCEAIEKFLATNLIQYFSILEFFVRLKSEIGKNRSIFMLKISTTEWKYGTDCLFWNQRLRLTMSDVCVCDWLSLSEWWVDWQCELWATHNNNQKNTHKNTRLSHVFESPSPWIVAYFIFSLIFTSRNVLTDTNAPFQFRTSSLSNREHSSIFIRASMSRLLIDAVLYRCLWCVINRINVMSQCLWCAWRRAILSGFRYLKRHY